MAGNKIDIYEYEEIGEYEGLTLAKEFNALHQRISARFGEGIEDLFKRIGKKFLNSEYEDTCNMTKEEIKRNKLKINKIKNSQKKKKCC